MDDSSIEGLPEETLVGELDSGIVGIEEAL